MYKPDFTDWKIIELLNENGRMSSTEIARTLGDVSARTVSNRIDTLIKQNIINVRAIVNPEQVGYGVLADVYIDVEPGKVREVAEQAAKLPLISYVACATGATDVSISLRAKSIEELFNFVNDTLGSIPGVLRTQFYILPFKIKDLDTWMPPNVLDEKDKEKIVT
jgi:Lrp/AsnC family transcriptional regulator for asnA, asnC and gidA